MILAESNTAIIVAINAKLHTTREKTIIARFFQLVHFSSFVFKYNNVGNIKQRANPNDPPIKPKALVMFGNIIAVNAHKLTMKTVARRCSHVFDSLFNPINLNIYSLQGAAAKVRLVTTFMITPNLPISIR